MLLTSSKDIRQGKVVVEVFSPMFRGVFNPLSHCVGWEENNMNRERFLMIFRPAIFDHVQVVYCSVYLFL